MECKSIWTGCKSTILDSLSFLVGLAASLIGAYLPRALLPVDPALALQKESTDPFLGENRVRRLIA